MNIAENIERQLPPDLLELAKNTGRLASEMGQRPYLVGGVVRDAILGRPNLDLDIVVEGDAPSLARQLSAFLGGKVTIHSRFGTATFVLDSMNLDLVTARSETYPGPGALPVVRPGTIEDDLFRRDFTINAMAIRIDVAMFGELVDPYCGRRDISDGVIRILHSRSFTDDPTRIWRAVRYEQRLDFNLEPETEGLLRRDLHFTEAISGDRLRHELDRVLEEDEPEKALSRAEQLGVLQRVEPSLNAGRWLAERYARLRQDRCGGKPDPEVYLVLLAWRLDEDALRRVMERLRIGGKRARALRDIARLKQSARSLQSLELQPSYVVHTLEGIDLSTIRAGAVAGETEASRYWLERYLCELRNVAISLTGQDMRGLGVAPGRRMGILLRELADAKLDGRLRTREEEVAYVRDWLRRHTGR